MDFMILRSIPDCYFFFIIAEYKISPVGLLLHTQLGEVDIVAVFVEPAKHGYASKRGHLNKKDTMCTSSQYWNRCQGTFE